MFGRLRAYKVSDCLNDEKSAGFGLTKRSVRKKVIDLKMLQKVHICCLFLGLLLLATSLTHGTFASIPSSVIGRVIEYFIYMSFTFLQSAMRQNFPSLILYLRQKS